MCPTPRPRPSAVAHRAPRAAAAAVEVAVAAQALHGFSVAVGQIRHVRSAKKALHRPRPAPESSSTTRHAAFPCPRHGSSTRSYPAPHATASTRRLQRLPELRLEPSSLMRTVSREAARPRGPCHPTLVGLAASSGANSNSKISSLSCMSHLAWRSRRNVSESGQRRGPCPPRTRAERRRGRRQVELLLIRLLDLAPWKAPGAALVWILRLLRGTR